MPYGQQGRMGDRVQAGLFNPDFSGHANAGMISGQALNKMGGQIGDLIKERGEFKKKLAGDEKFIKQAYEMFKGTEMEGTIGGVWDRYTSEDVTDREKDAIGTSIRETIQLGMAAQDMKMKQAALSARGGAKPPITKEWTDPQGNKQMLQWDHQTGEWGAPSIDPSLLSTPSAMHPEGGGPVEADLQAEWIKSMLPPEADLGVDSYPSVLPMRDDPAAMNDPYLRTPTTPDGGWGADPSLPGDPVSPVASQGDASMIMDQIVQGSGARPQPQAAPIQQAVQGRWGLTRPDRGDQYEQFIRDGKLMQRNTKDGKVSAVGGGGIKIDMGGKGLTDARFAEGWRLRTGPDGEEEQYPIEGSEAWFKVEEWKRKAEEAKGGGDASEKSEVDAAQKTRNMLREVDRGLDALKGVKEAGLGRWLQVGKGKIAPGTPEFDATRAAEAVGNMLLPAELAKMRESSPTGSTGMGALNQSEGDAMRQQYGALDLRDGPKVFSENLVDLRNSILDTAHGTREQRAQWLRDGTITREENAEVERLYGDYVPAYVPKASRLDDETEALLKELGID